MDISKKLYSDIVKYCKLNNIDDIDGEINRFIQIGFNIERFGNQPFSQHEKIETSIPNKPIVETQEKITVEKEESVEKEKKETKKKTTSTTERKTKSKIRIIKNEQSND